METRAYKPAGRPDVSVYIMASDAPAGIAFAVAVLGAGEEPSRKESRTRLCG